MRCPDVGPVENRRILRHPVEVEEEAVDIAREVGKHQRCSGESDQANPVDLLRLGLEEVLELDQGAVGARGIHIARVHRGRAIENENEVLSLELGGALLGQELRPGGRADDQTHRRAGEHQDSQVTSVRRSARDSGKPRQHPLTPPAVALVGEVRDPEKHDRRKRQQPDGDLRVKEAHPSADLLHDALLLLLLLLRTQQLHQ